MDSLFLDPPSSFIRLLRSQLKDDSIKPIQVKKALNLLWSQTSDVLTSYHRRLNQPMVKVSKLRKAKLKPKSITQTASLRKSLNCFVIDQICREFAPANVTKRYLVKYVAYSHNKKNFCCVSSEKWASCLAKLKYTELKSPPDFIRDVSNIGHWE